MLFQTPEFLVLMTVVLLAMAVVRKHSWQLIILLIASYIFYMGWSRWFLSLLLFSTFNAYFCGLQIQYGATRRRQQFWLTTAIVLDLALLAFFKYGNFTLGSINDVLTWSGSYQRVRLIEDLVVPVGISFYTFHTIGYCVDVYRGDAQAEPSLLRFSLFVAFFPQLVAGPILRSTHFLPQIRNEVTLRSENLRSGFNLALVGLVKKVLVADQIAPLVNFIFDDPQGLPSAFILLGALGFGIQIYCDFSGYTDIAIGVGRMLGFEISKNFNYPYVAHSITDFWRRWHISLSTWLRDYLYVPLGGNRHGTFNTYRNLMITMTLGGLWHGAAWNFVIWGFYQGLLLTVERMFGWGSQRPPSQQEADVATVGGQRGSAKLSLRGRLGWAIAWVVTQYLVFLGWLIFRVGNYQDLFYCVRKYVVFDFDTRVSALGAGNVNPFLGLGMIGLFIVLHTASYQSGGFARRLDTMWWPLRSVVYVVTCVALVTLWPSTVQSFIYFQF